MIGLQLKTILIGAIYKKSLTMNNEAKKESTAGEIVNLMSVDTQRINDMMMIFILAWTTPFQVILAITILYQYLGPAALAGLAVMLMTVPFNAYVARVTETLQEENLKFKDARLRLTNESLSGMKVLKLYAWEPSFRDKITAIRDGEIGILRKIAFLNALSYVVFSWTPYLVTLVTFAVYVSTGSDNQLTAGKAFVALSFFNIIKVPLALLSTIISQSVQAKVSVDRISKFLSTGDLSPKNVQRDGHAANAIEVNNGNFSWDREKSPTLRNINLRVPKGSLCAVVGPVGSGKSSLVSALLGEMEKTTGSVVVSHQVAYVPQQAWIQCATVKDNILFGKPFNRRRYNRVIEACALERDLEILSAGDLTEIGEKGINLSGGQKQRVSLARAVYSGADIFMFDDPLSAVDAHVGKYIFDRVIGKSGILKGKTRVLVTHGANWLPMVDSILVMMNGKISESGAYEDLMNGKAGFADFIKTHLVQPKAKNNDEEEVTPQRSNMLSRSKSRNEQNNAGSDGMTSGEEGVKLAGRPKPRRRQTSVFEASMASMLETSVTLGNKGQGYSFEEDKAKAKSGKLVQKETLQSGNVKLSVFMSYATAAGCLPLLASIVLFLGSAVSYAAATFWITDWTEDPLLGNASLVNTPEWDDRNAYYLGVFSVFGIIQVVLLAIHNLLYWTRCVKAAQVLHHDVLGCVLRSPMAFFDTTPLGRIMNRFSRDVEVVDNLLPMNFRDYIFTFTNCVLTMLIITINTPLFLLMAVPILGVYFFIQSFYIPTGRQLKRIESVTRSPIYSHFSETLSGGPTIRAYGVTERFQQELMARVDRNQSFWYINLACNRWLGISLETLANFVVFGAAMFGVLTPGLGGGALGLSVSYALQVSGSLIWMVRQKTELETNSVSVERIKEYSELMPEADWVVPHRRPVPEWPQEGVVTFTDYRTRYRDGLDLVLKGMTCEFKGGEKIGIVGRTGAGKSSLALAMFRLIEASSGAISVDGVRISDIGLHDVRAKLTILPQDPVLFFGSLRMNLDPEGMYTDHKLWQALTSAHLKEFVQNTRERLDYQVGEEGQSLSVGQRQLVCLARALLKKTRILILDEATAAVDMDTDQLIQSTIRSEFSSCTIITIAHRLNTIMDYDRIMVLDAGLITEMDTPTNLLADPSSVFYSMAKEAGLV